jgi:hypothetical protein
MIKYTLRCASEHHFEAWFQSSASFEEQKKEGLLRCPECGSDGIEKAPMAPNVVTRKGSSKRPVAERPRAPNESAASAPSSPPQEYSPVSLEPKPEKVTELMRQLRSFVESNTVDVGRRFAEEARKIHYEEAEPRGIRGEATATEVEDLREEGIQVSPLPRLPEDNN